MGGQLEFGGIWLPAEPFGEGSSAESCSTFRGYKRLSKEPHFRIRSIEVWGVGDKPSLEKDDVCVFIYYEKKYINGCKSSRYGRKKYLYL